MQITMDRANFLKILDNYKALSRLILHNNNAGNVDKVGIPSIDTEVDLKSGEPVISVADFVKRYPVSMEVVTVSAS